MNISVQMTKKDKVFFEKHWQQWVKENPPPKGWLKKWTLRDWAEFEMPSCGFFGRLLYRLLYD